MSPTSSPGRPRATASIARFLLLLVVGWIPLSCAPREDEEEPPSGPAHVLLVSLDTLRADHLGVYGYSRPTSPFLDRLAAEGTRFSRTWVNTHGTPSSHATLFSSLYQETHRVSFPGEDGEADHSVPEALTLLPEVLRGAGYRTLAVTGGGWMSESFGFGQGFDAFEAVDDRVAVGADRLVELVEEQLADAQASGAPIFAFFHTYEIHSPYLPPERYRRGLERFESTFVPTSPNLLRIRSEAWKHLSERDFEFLEASYAAGIRYTDDVLRSLFARLEALGFLDDALVVITSDHGEEFGEHGRVLHPVSLHEELLHVPLIFWGKDVPRGAVDPRLVSLLDVGPTILEQLGVDVPPSMQGRSVLHRMEAMPVLHENDSVFAQHTDDLYAMRNDRWKLIEITGTGELSLFDLRKDPGERVDLAATRPQLARRLLVELRKWRRGLPRLDVERHAAPLLEEAQLEQLRTLGYVD